MTERDTAVVKLGLGFTVNLGNFESARIDAGVELQGSKDNLQALWKEAGDEITQQLDVQIKMLKAELNSSRTTILGLDKKPNITANLR